MKVNQYKASSSVPKYQQLVAALLALFGAAIVEQGTILDLITSILQLPALAEYLTDLAPSWTGLIPIVLAFLVQALNWRKEHPPVVAEGGGDVSIQVEDTADPG